MKIKFYEDDILPAIKEKYGDSIMNREIIGLCDAGLDENAEFYIELQTQEPCDAFTEEEYDDCLTEEELLKEVKENPVEDVQVEENSIKENPFEGGE